LRRLQKVVRDEEIMRRIALAVTKAGSVSWSHYVALCGGKPTADLLLQQNLFVLDVDLMVRFENTVLESASKQLVEQQSKVEGDVIVN